MHAAMSRVPTARIGVRRRPLALLTSGTPPITRAGSRGLPAKTAILGRVDGEAERRPPSDREAAGVSRLVGSLDLTKGAVKAPIDHLWITPGGRAPKWKHSRTEAACRRLLPKQLPQQLPGRLPATDRVDRALDSRFFERGVRTSHLYENGRRIRVGTTSRSPSSSPAHGGADQSNRALSLPNRSADVVDEPLLGQVLQLGIGPRCRTAGRGHHCCGS